jgi:hypothetical protein
VQNPEQKTRILMLIALKQWHKKQNELVYFYLITMVSIFTVGVINQEQEVLGRT